MARPAIQGIAARFGVALPEEALLQNALNRHRPAGHALLSVFLLVSAALPALGQDPLINEDDATMPETGLGNVAQEARAHFSSGMRLMKQAAKLEGKLDEAETPEKLEHKIASVRERAIDEFKEAIGYSPNMLEAYAALGAVLSDSGQVDQALRVHARALTIDPTDEENFRGWAEAILDLNMLGDATQAYTSLRQTRPEQAATLMTLMKDWLAEKRSDPAGLEAADIERLADWIESQQEGAG